MSVQAAGTAIEEKVAIPSDSSTSAESTINEENSKTVNENQSESPREVTWDGDDDPENPRKWPKWKKWYSPLSVQNSHLGMSH
jgi:hypothetical protein